MSTAPETKRLLRQELRRRLGQLSNAERLAASARICERITEQEFWTSAQYVLAFLPTLDEPDIWPLLNGLRASTKRLGFPRYNSLTGLYEVLEVTEPGRELQCGRFGILEPAGKCPRLSLNQLDLALVPGLGFGENGARVGRGKGYYDRLLTAVRGAKCGVAFDTQLGLTIPVESHDIHMDVVITESHCLKCNPFGAST